MEGDKGAVHGVWQVSIADSKMTGNAAMISPKGKPLTYQLGGTVRNGKLVAQRIQPSDRAGCTYVADIGAKAGSQASHSATALTILGS